jgi:hypothetical protein
VIAGTAVNYSRNVTAGVFAPTVVTIGYDAPWRQVEALLLARTTRPAVTGLTVQGRRSVAAGPVQR